MENVSKDIPGFGDRLGRLRTERGLSQSDLAHTIGISRPNYTAIENQVPGRFLKDYQLKALADKLDVSSDYLLGRILDPNPSADLHSIITALKISSDTANKIRKIHENSILFNKFNIFEDFMNNFDSDFWDTLGLYKKVNAFYQSEYQFVIQFEKDIYPGIVDFVSLEPHLENFVFERKYFYVDKDIVNDLYQKHSKIFSDTSLSLHEKWDCLSALIDTGNFSELYTFAYSDSKKKQEFISALNRVKETLDKICRMVDFDEACLIFSLFDKQEEIFKNVDELLEKINKDPKDAIDNAIENLWSSLSFFNKTVNSSLNFIKYKITNEFNKYLDNCEIFR